MSEWNIIYKVGTVEHVRATVKRLEYHGKLMDERYITVDVDSPSQISFSAGDYMMYRGEKFSIRNIADVEKSARQQSYGGAFTYKGMKLVAQGWQELQDTEMTDYVHGDNTLHYTGLGTFSFYMTKVSDMGYRVQAVLDNKYGTEDDAWTVNWPSGVLDGLDEAKSISISAGTSVKETLDMLWQNWGIAYTVNRKTITLRPSSAGSIMLSYGKGNGLTKIARKLNPNVEICTRVRAYGSERNMPYHWYNNKYNDVNEAMYIPQLMLPHTVAYYDEDGNYVNESGILYVAGDDEVVGSVNIWATPNDVVLENVVKSRLYGKRDKEIHWNSDEMGEIFPSMKGMTASDITGLQTKTYLNLGDLDRILSFSYESSGDTGSSSPEDVTSDKLNFIVYVPNPGFNPTDHNTSDNVELLVQSGMCQARAFTIIKSEGCDTNGDPVTDDTGTVVQYKLTCAKIIDEEIDQVFPNSPDFEIEAGDYYVYTGLEFNGNYSQDTWLDVYIEAAEKRLLRAAAIWLKEHSEENFVYELTPDNLYMKNNPNEAANLTEGAMIHIPDTEFGSNEYEIIDSLTITEGKEAIPTYEITLLRKDESESLGDRVKGLVGQSISASSEIAKANDGLAKKVNKTGFHTLFDPLDAQYNVLDINGDLSNLKYIRANVDFYSVKGVSALGTGGPGGGGGGGASTLNELDDVTIQSPQNGQYLSYNSSTGMWENVTGGGGGGVTLREPLSSINNASLGTPTESGQVLTWNGSQWIYAIPQGGGGGGTGTVTSITAGTGLSGGTITTMGTIAISSEYQTRIANGQTAYGWGNHANAGYLTSSDIADMATKTWVNQQGFLTSETYTGTVTSVGLSMPTGFSVSGSPITSSGTLTVDIATGYFLPTTTQRTTWNGKQDAISDLSTIRTNASHGEAAYNSLSNYLPLAGGTMTGALHLGSASGASPYIYWGDSTYVYIGEDSDDHMTIRGARGVNILTGSGYDLEWNGDALATQDWVVAQDYVTSNQIHEAKWWGQSMDGNNVVSGDIAMNVGDRIYYDGNNTLEVDNYSVALGYGWRSTKPMGLYGTAINFYPNGSQVAIVDSSGLRVNGGYYLDGKLFANNNNGLHIGYGFADAELPTTIWGDGLSFRSVDGNYGSCTNIGNTYGIMGTDFIGVTNKFRFEYDSTNNTVWVLKADGTPVNFASMGGVSALGVGSSGTPSIDSLRVTRLYFDASRFLEVSGSTLRYYNGSSYKTIAT